jgi:predicted transcriptional regulator
VVAGTRSTGNHHFIQKYFSEDRNGRNMAQYSQKDICSLLGITRETLRHYEKEASCNIQTGGQT